MIAQQRFIKNLRASWLRLRISRLYERRQWFEQLADYNRREAARATDNIARIRRELVTLDVPGLHSRVGSAARQG